MFEARNKYRPPSAEKVLWFEFLINPNFLESYLAEPNTDPGPTDLIIKFLGNSMAPINIDQPGNMNLNQHGGNEEKEDPKKIALKLLALKVAAHLKWDLNILEKSKNPYYIKYF
ncbi:integrator complex subunit 8 [Caerostris extrusa]|uniref:Integrator complex subunit 8 n=1 Tax=Caerostris extrusa TaxID=172846 RepID=A0AAV4STS5_CAEEX|nr:integrator complex subunit 8 [Caerostris extrusa]